MNSNEVTATIIRTYPAVEADAITRDWEADGITRLTEDENPYFSGALDGDTEDEAPEDWHWLVGVEG